MTTLIAALYDRFFGTTENIVVNARVNRIAGIEANEKIDGRVLKLDGDRAKVCWPRGEKTMENVRNLVLIAE
ncbi:hypothetical protein [Andreprevotia chitinilytica]|uniref:hypothetical protein n=1 Tax=Andreprevotia chitinilytica TaxID=396808 RepID=UPI0005554F92|nr:hypothetical protein [Andreprevotia chitinilytica]